MNKIAKSAFLHPTVKIGEYVTIGDNVLIAEGSVIGNYTEIRSDCWIGKNTRLGSRCTLSAGTWIGDNCEIHYGFVSTDHAGEMDKRTRPCLVMHGVKTGVSVSVAPGVVIGEGAILGAHSYIKTDVGKGEVWAGVPAKKLNKNK